MNSTTRCLICRTAITWTGSGGNGFWEHDDLSQDRHQVLPIPVSDSPLGSAVALLDSLLETEPDHERATSLYEALFALAWTEFELTDGATIGPRTTPYLPIGAGASVHNDGSGVLVRLSDAIALLSGASTIHCPQPGCGVRIRYRHVSPAEARRLSALATDHARHSREK
ncbi:hypothetical protein [Streptomyces triculaminicus]|uniref:hypothetical protein n=1 Tax=Streptomyces triculaminicus TaxID=2816232 RepID=UPI0037ADACCB